jgi:hypothetical protein
MNVLNVWGWSISTEKTEDFKKEFLNGKFTMSRPSDGGTYTDSKLDEDKAFDDFLKSDTFNYIMNLKD